jgi:septal ring factor EnvC (AmiA/AmiB activator)
MTEISSPTVDELQSNLRDRDQDVTWLWSSGRTMGAQLAARLAQEAKSADGLIRAAVDAAQAAEKRAAAAEKRAAAAERRAAAAETSLRQALESETWAVGRAVLFGPRYVMKRLRPHVKRKDAPDQGGT